MMRRAKSGAATATTAALALACAACSVVRAPDRPNWTTYLLEPAERAAESESLAAADDARALRVAPIECAGGYDTPRMAYVRAAGTIEYFAQHRWAEPPAELLAPLLVASLERSGRFASVLAPSSRASGDFVLETELLAFRQELAGAPVFRATMRATMVDSASGRAVGVSRTFDVVEAMDEASPAAGAAAAQRASARLVDAVAAFCGRDGRP